MTVTYGFYNSKNGDRVYNAEQFSSFLDGIVYDGVYSAIGTKFEVRVKSGMQITVGVGRAWFDHTWTLNNSLLGLTVPAADTVYKRIDAVVIEINKTDRRNYIKIIKGTPAASPAKPKMTKTAAKIQYPLAYITVNKGVKSLTQSNIQYVVGSQECPIASAIALAGIPSGGKIGYVLAKKSEISGAVGWYHYDNLPHDKWYLTDGIKESNVLAAYKFYKGGDATKCLTPVNDSKTYKLTRSNIKTVTWNISSGYLIPQYQCLDNAALRAMNPKTIIMRFSHSETSAPLMLTGGYKDDFKYHTLYVRTPYAVQSFAWQVTNTLGFQIGWNDSGKMSNNVRTSTQVAQNGVIGITWSATGGAIYYNGTSVATAAPPKVNGYSISAGVNTANAGRLIGMRNKLTSGRGWADPELFSKGWGSFYIQYALFLNCTLSAAQHKQIASQIVSDMKN